ncbi:MAG TPA: HAD family acid phosphatase [Gemmatimonadota bacterium]|nr:HAD family acid phosphatase [Gemmatimonadota bacterium]
MTAIRLRPLGAVAIVALAACATAPARDAATPAAAEHPLLQSVLWVQTSAEYHAAAEQAFAAAGAALERALADSTWTAELTQTGDYAALPPAVIVDVDETMLDNSPFEARLVLSGETFDPADWAAWVEEAAAPPVPGALEFAREADRRGVTIFYVTNRDAPGEAATRRNLERAGFPLPDDPDVLLLRGERPDWTSDKTSRRAHVAADHRVLVVIGDDFNDFVLARLPLEERDTLVRRHTDRWGERWIVLPNPMYGSWETAAIGPGEDLSDEEELARKLERLRTRGIPGP